MINLYMHCLQNSSNLKTITALKCDIFIYTEKLYLRKMNDKIS